jgi:hypothetical protein
MAPFFKLSSSALVSLATGFETRSLSAPFSLSSVESYVPGVVS